MPDETQNSLSNHNVKLEVDENISISLPPFWHEMPSLWFTQAEAVFTAKRVSSDSKQYLFTVAALPVDIIATVSDVISAPPENDKFRTLKNEIIKRLSLSETQRLEKLIGTTTMGDLIPSAFYRKLQQLAGSSTAVTEDLLKNLWFKRLPEQLRSIVLVQESEPITKLTALADKIWEYHRPSTSTAICSNSCDNKPSAPEPLTLENLAIAIDELRQQIFNRDRSRSRSFTRNRPRSQSRSKPRSTSKKQKTHKFCYYHFRFGAAAKKCGGNCSFTTSQKHSTANSEN